ncbi:MAG: RlmE family RNA methyltransferase [Crenarchaeota archaeon]|nr:RlmE family RNA methyltransferase [Thermoproteota archaeon]
MPNIISGYKKEKVKVKTAKRRKVSSTKWLQRQLNDPYVSLAKQKDYRSRAAFKILEIDEKFKIFKKGCNVLDLGAAPGGWSQVIMDKVGKDKVLAVDILPMQPITGVKFIQQDFLASGAEDLIIAESNGKKYDVVMSDMAANTTGNKDIDHIRTTNLVEEAFNFSLKILKDDGSFIAKVFQGGTEPELFKKMKENFKTIKHFKPDSSRKESVEMYVIAIGFKGKTDA